MFEWHTYTRIIQGKGAIAKARGELERHGVRRAVVITDRGVSEAGVVAEVVEKLGDACAGVFDEVPQDTAYDAIGGAYEYAKSVAAEAVVSVGGGSVIDTAKTVCILLAEGGKAQDHIGLYVLKRRGAPHVAIPTTAGTGSEVTAVAVVFDSKKNKKLYYMSEHIVPETAILDPAMTASMPPALTASTGMDALTHAIETTVSSMRNPLSTALALQAIKIIRQHLAECVKDGSKLDSREAVQVAATMAGMAFASSHVGAVHAIAHSFGASEARVPHGVANGILLPPVMRFNAPACAREMAEVAIAMGAERGGRSDEDLAIAAADEVEKILDETNHPRRLSEVGVKEDQISRCARTALKDPAIFTNPRKIASPEEAEKIIREVF